MNRGIKMWIPVPNPFLYFPTYQWQPLSEMLIGRVCFFKSSCISLLPTSDEEVANQHLSYIRINNLKSGPGSRELVLVDQ